jgi:hypothetical protein
MAARDKMFPTIDADMDGVLIPASSVSTRGHARRAPAEMGQCTGGRRTGSGNGPATGQGQGRGQGQGQGAGQDGVPRTAPAR